MTAPAWIGSRRAIRDLPERSTAGSLAEATVA